MHPFAIILSLLACLLGFVYLRKSFARRKPRAELPVELQLRILNLAAASLTRQKDYSKRTRSLLNLARVSHAFNKEVQPYLWHTIHATSHTRLLSLAKLLASRPDMQPFVRVLDVRLTFGSGNVSPALRLLASLCPNLDQAFLRNVCGLELSVFRQWSQLRQLHLRACSFSFSNEPASPSIQLTSVTHLTCYDMRYCFHRAFYARCTSLLILATDESVTLPAAAAARLIALATPSFNLSSGGSGPGLPSARLVLLPPNKYSLSRETIWHIDHCPSLRTLVSYDKHVPRASDLARLLPELRAVQQAGAGWAERRRAAGEWAKQGVKWTALKESDFYEDRPSQQVVDNFVEMADRAIAERDAECAAATATTESLL